MKEVYKRICNAQIASDGGKGIETLKEFNPTIWRVGYKAKDREIMRAIDLIEKGKGNGVSYYIRYEYTDKYGFDCYVVYFNFKLDGKARQISFHTFNDLEKYVDWYSPNWNHKTRWKRKIKSRETVMELLTA